MALREFGCFFKRSTKDAVETHATRGLDGTGVKIGNESTPDNGKTDLPHDSLSIRRRFSRQIRVGSSAFAEKA